MAAAEPRKEEEVGKEPEESCKKVIERLLKLIRSPRVDFSGAQES